MSARDFGMPDDPWEIAEEEVRPYLALTLEERFARFADIMCLMEAIGRSLPPEKRARYRKANDRQDDPGRWWERVPVR